MYDFEDRARRAGDALNDSVIDLEPAPAAPPPPRTRRHAGVALLAVAALVAAGVAVAQRDDGRERLRADLPASTTAPTPTTPPRYLPRWLPPDVAPSTGVVGVSGCMSSSSGQSPATTLSVPPGVQVHSGDLTGTIQIRTATAAAIDEGGCVNPSWTAIFAGPASGGARVVFLHGGASSATPSGAEAVTIHGRAASLTSVSSSSPAPWWVLAWTEDDTTLSMTAVGLTREEVLRIAESVERVSDADWDKVITTTQSQTATRSFVRPDLTTATELARLTTPDGQVARLLATADGSSICITTGNGSGCSSTAFPNSMPARLTALSDGYGLIALPAGLPADVTIRRPSGETLPSARSSDGRYLLIAGANLGTDYEIIDTAGQVLVTAKGFPCPQGTASATLCTPTTSR